MVTSIDQLYEATLGTSPFATTAAPIHVFQFPLCIYVTITLAASLVGMHTADLALEDVKPGHDAIQLDHNACKLCF